MRAMVWKIAVARWSPRSPEASARRVLSVLRARLARTSASKGEVRDLDHQGAAEGSRIAETAPDFDGLACQRGPARGIGIEQQPDREAGEQACAECRVRGAQGRQALLQELVDVAAVELHDDVLGRVGQHRPSEQLRVAETAGHRGGFGEVLRDAARSREPQHLTKREEQLVPPPVVAFGRQHVEGFEGALVMHRRLLEGEHRNGVLGGAH